MVLRNSTPGGFAYIWQSKWVGIIAMKTERTQIHFWIDVFAVVASSDRKVPNNLCGPRPSHDVDAICKLSWLLVLFLLARFFSRYSGFPASTQKSKLPNSNSIWTNTRTGLNSNVFWWVNKLHFFACAPVTAAYNLIPRVLPLASRKTPGCGWSCDYLWQWTPHQAGVNVLIL